MISVVGGWIYLEKKWKTNRNNIRAKRYLNVKSSFFFVRTIRSLFTHAAKRVRRYIFEMASRLQARVHCGYRAGSSRFPYSRDANGRISKLDRAYKLTKVCMNFRKSVVLFLSSRRTIIATSNNRKKVLLRHCTGTGPTKWLLSSFHK